MTEKRTVINAPADKVFSYLADFPRHSEWAKHKLQIEQSSAGAVGQGTMFKSVGHEMGRANEETVTITEFRSGERITYEVQGKAGHFRHWIQLSPADGGVEVTKGLEVVKANFPYNMLFPVMAPFVVPSGLSGDLERIKAKVEGS
jgi:uncharacterized membrane protein